MSPSKWFDDRGQDLLEFQRYQLHNTVYHSPCPERCASYPVKGDAGCHSSGGACLLAKQIRITPRNHTLPHSLQSGQFLQRVYFVPENRRLARRPESS